MYIHVHVHEKETGYFLNMEKKYNAVLIQRMLNIRKKEEPSGKGWNYIDEDYYGGFL